MRPFAKTIAVQLKLFGREPAAVFFTLLLPLMLLLLNGQGGNTPEILVPGLTAFILATAGWNLAEAVATDRDKGVLRRLRATPLPAWTVLTAHAGVQALVTGIGLVLLVAAGAAFFDLALPAAPIATALSLALGVASFLSISFVLAALAPNARAANAVAAALYFFPMIFLSGATWPREALPSVAARIGDFLPLAYVVRALIEPWVSGRVDVVALAVLSGMLVAGVLISSRMFR